MAYLGNLICNDCGLTFTAQWGAIDHADEYRCDNDHVVLVRQSSGDVVAIEGIASEGRSLVDLHGRCPLCDTELATGLLPACPICSGRDHQVLMAGTIS